MEKLNNFFAANALRRAEWTGLPPMVGDFVEVEMIDGSARFYGHVDGSVAEGWISVRVDGIGLYGVPTDCAQVVRRADA